MQIDAIRSAFSMGYTFRTLREAIQKGTKLTALPPAPRPDHGDALPYDFLALGQGSKKNGPTVPEFSISAMHEYLVKFIVVDDQVST
jgi:hypothetical protein